MNETVKLQHSHRSDRAYTNEPVSDAMLEAIVEAAHHAPTSMNGQQVSLVVVRDTARRAKISQIANGQPWIAQAPVFIAVVVDFNKTKLGADIAGAHQIIHESLEGFAVGALDAGIALGNLMVAARSLGLGVVPIGSIRRDSQAMIDLLELPPLTFPIAGVCIGHVSQAASQKPRMPIASFRHDERYCNEAIPAAIAEYDKTLTEYWHSIGRTDGMPWSANTASAYKTVYFPATYKVATTQGFTNDK